MPFAPPAVEGESAVPSTPLTALKFVTKEFAPARPKAFAALPAMPEPRLFF